MKVNRIKIVVSLLFACAVLLFVMSASSESVIVYNKNPYADEILVYGSVNALDEAAAAAYTNEYGSITKTEITAEDLLEKVKSGDEFAIKFASKLGLGKNAGEIENNLQKMVDEYKDQISKGNAFTEPRFVINGVNIVMNKNIDQLRLTRNADGTYSASLEGDQVGYRGSIMIDADASITIMYDEKGEAKIERRVSNGKPTDFVITLDVSGSMDWGGRDEAMLSALKTVLEEILQEEENTVSIVFWAQNGDVMRVDVDESGVQQVFSGEDGMTALKLFDAKLVDRFDNVSSYSLSDATIDQIEWLYRTGSGTEPDKGLEKAITLLENIEKSDERNTGVMLFTDGEANYTSSERKTVELEKQIAEEYGATLVNVSIGDEYQVKEYARYLNPKSETYYDQDQILKDKVLYYNIPSLTNQELADKVSEMFEVAFIDITTETKELKTETITDGVLAAYGAQLIETIPAGFELVEIKGETQQYEIRGTDADGNTMISFNVVDLVSGKDQVFSYCVIPTDGEKDIGVTAFTDQTETVLYARPVDRITYLEEEQIVKVTLDGYNTNREAPQRPSLDDMIARYGDKGEIPLDMDSMDSELVLSETSENEEKTEDAEVEAEKNDSQPVVVISADKAATLLNEEITISVEAKGLSGTALVLVDGQSKGSVKIDQSGSFAFTAHETGSRSIQVVINNVKSNTVNVDVTEKPLCKKHQWGKDEIDPDKLVWKPYPGYANKKHYLAEKQTTKKCKVCGLTETTKETYTSSNTPMIAAHTIGGIANECTLCGQKAGLHISSVGTNQDTIEVIQGKIKDELKFVYKESINPMDGNKSSIPSLLRDYYDKIGLNNSEIKSIISVLEKAKTTYRDIYLLSLNEYTIEIDRSKEEKSGFALGNHTLAMNKLQKGDNFEDVFFHESGHAAQESPMTRNMIRDDWQLQTSPQYDSLLEIYDCLKNDVSDRIDETLDDLSMSYLFSDLEDIRKQINSINDYDSAYSFISMGSLFDYRVVQAALGILTIEESTSAISAANNVWDFTIYAADLPLPQPSNSPVTGDIFMTAEWRKAANKAIDNLEDAIMKKLGIDDHFDFSDSMKDQVRKNIQTSFIDDYYYHPDQEYPTENIVNGNYVSPELAAYYKMLRWKLSNEIYDVTLDGNSNVQSSMVADVYGGVTNRKINAIAGHENAFLRRYWYHSTGTPTYNQIYEAWAEFYAAQIRGDKTNKANNHEYFPTATARLEQFADELKDYYMDKLLDDD